MAVLPRVPIGRHAATPAAAAPGDLSAHHGDCRDCSVACAPLPAGRADPVALSAHRHEVGRNPGRRRARLRVAVGTSASSVGGRRRRGCRFRGVLRSGRSRRHAEPLALRRWLHVGRAVRGGGHCGGTAWQLSQAHLRSRPARRARKRLLRTLPVARADLPWCSALGGRRARPVQIGIALRTTAVATVASWRFVERPASAYFRRTRARRTEHAPAAP